MTDEWHGSVLRMEVWRDHIEDCAGLCEPLSWEDFKRCIWNRWPNDWSTCLLQAAKLAHKIHCEKSDEWHSTCQSFPHA